MSTGVLLDTHVWVWLANGLLHPDPVLVEQLNRAGLTDSLFLCSISLYEIANGARRGRIDLLRSLEDWFAANLVRPGVRIVPVTPEIAIETTRLPIGFHGDPGDRLIAATARVEELTLITHDKALLRFGKQGHLRVLKARQKRSVA
jgi:PIN domain nuclease of toxin-antitoxin system